MILGVDSKAFIAFFTDTISLELEHDCYLINYSNKQQTPLMIAKQSANQMLQNTESNLSLHYFLQQNDIETQEEMDALQALDTSLRIKESDGSTRFLNPGEFKCPLTREIVCEWDLVDLNNVFAIAAFKSRKDGFEDEDLNKILVVNPHILKKGKNLLDNIDAFGAQAMLSPLEISTLQRFGITFEMHEKVERYLDEEKAPNRKKRHLEGDGKLDKFLQDTIEVDLALAMSLAKEEGDQLAILQQFEQKRLKIDDTNEAPPKPDSKKKAKKKHGKK